MKCKNCQFEMTALNGAPYEKPTLLWCEQCGMLLVNRPRNIAEKNVTESSRETIWFEPQSIENTKKLVQRLLKAEKKVSVINKGSQNEMDKIEWNDDGRD